MEISKLIIKTLCDNHGSLDFKRLNEELSLSSVAKTDLRSILFDDGKIAIREGKKLATDCLVGPDSVVVAKTRLRICQKKAGECMRCDGLHLCRYYVCGSCTFGQKCKNPHSLANPYNAELLRRHGLCDLTEKQLFQLLLQNDPYLLPEVCPHYNKGDGPFGSCKFATSCTKLHICLHFLQGDCKFGTTCKRSHTVDTQGRNLFRGFSQENLQNFHKFYRSKYIIMDQQTRQAPVLPVLPEIGTDQPSHQLSYKKKPGSPTSSTCPTKPMSDVEKNEICLFFIRRHCSFKEKCARVHWHLPYRWQVLEKDGQTWKDLPSMEDIEKAYCDPACDTSCMDQPSATLGLLRHLTLQSSASSVDQHVDFKTMTYGGSPVRRLSTASTVSKPPHFILTTQWTWYWKDGSGLWLEYGQGDGDSTVTSQTLENLYLADRDTEIPFGAGKQQYVLHFKDATGTQQMYQQNVKYKTKREVRRRPRFVSASDVEMKLRSEPSRGTSSSSAESVPSYWDKNALPEFGYKLVSLSGSAKDYNMIEKLFRQTMPHGKISSIERIQNPSLWKVFQWQKEQMQKRNEGKLVDQKYLFHGTDESLIDAICEQNFDWRMCGVHGTAYGKGSYFARDASYSDRYSRAKGNSNKIMFVALVLVGQYTKGRSSYVKPPPKGGSRTLYDSCVDTESNPSIYVVFEKQQIYPEYLIKYM
ncbi:protein mono-ADP-ribosyltransferase PARP12 isoform X1 [Leuresthes tenuis]|uniref:protein mono-ADP-ribosyltransferase PARP12 isoform X1 n=1 Tax=Leuresthes tenuis TaxID=355514 RepID=UPI003B50594F